MGVVNLAVELWVVVTCDDEQWQSLCHLMGTSNVSELTGEQRQQRQDELEELICDWTSALSNGDVMERCVAAGIPAHQVQNSRHVLVDPQLQHRNHFIEVGHPTQGTTTIENTRFIMSRTPAVVTYGGPTWGEHNWEILTEELGYEPDKIADLAIAEVLG